MECKPRKMSMFYSLWLVNVFPCADVLKSRTVKIGYSMESLKYKREAGGPEGGEMWWGKLRSQVGGCFVAGLEGEGRGSQVKEGSSAEKERIFSTAASSRTSPMDAFSISSLSICEILNFIFLLVYMQASACAYRSEDNAGEVGSH